MLIVDNMFSIDYSIFFTIRQYRQGQNSASALILLFIKNAGAIPDTRLLSTRIRLFHGQLHIIGDRLLVVAVRNHATILIVIMVLRCIDGQLRRLGAGLRRILPRR